MIVNGNANLILHSDFVGSAERTSSARGVSLVQKVLNLWTVLADSFHNQPMAFLSQAVTGVHTGVFCISACLKSEF